MARNKDDVTASEDDLSPDFDAGPAGKNQRREPSFVGFDEDDEDIYEEPDRDTDYAAGYRDDGAEEEEYIEDSLFDDEERDSLTSEDDDAEYPSSTRYSQPDRSSAEEPDDWLEREGYAGQDEGGPKSWPWGLIAVAIVALALLTAGGYGVMQQRAAMEEELLQLRATLATSARNPETSASRESLQNLQQSYDKLAATAETLALENRRLADTVAGLQAQLDVQQAVLTKTPPATATTDKPASSLPAAAADAASTPPGAPGPIAPESTSPRPVAPKPAATVPSSAPPPVPAPTTSPAASSEGPWFVNFGSYASRNVAESWAGKLRPGAGKIIIAPSTRDGQTLYRLRVVGLDSKSSAQEVARTLETQLQVSALWVGRE